MKSTPLLIYREILPDLPLFLRRHTWPRPQSGVPLPRNAVDGVCPLENKSCLVRGMKGNIAGKLSGGVNSSVMEAFSLRSDA